MGCLQSKTYLYTVGDNFVQWTGIQGPVGTDNTLRSFILPWTPMCDF